MPPRIKTPFARSPLTYSSGTTVGEQTISSSTTAPSSSSDGFEIAPTDPGLGSSQLAAPGYLSLVLELSGSAADDAEVNLSLWFYHPDAATANRWRESGPLVACGVNKRGAAGADASSLEQGNLYMLDCPPAASRAFVHIPSLPANVNVHVLAYGSN